MKPRLRREGGGGRGGGWRNQCFETWQHAAKVPACIRKLADTVAENSSHSKPQNERDGDFAILLEYDTDAEPQNNVDVQLNDPALQSSFQDYDTSFLLIVKFGFGY